MDDLAHLKWMYCKSLWIKASSRWINASYVSVSVNLNKAQQTYIITKADMDKHVQTNFILFDSVSSICLGKRDSAVFTSPITDVISCSSLTLQLITSNSAFTTYNTFLMFLVQTPPAPRHHGLCKMCVTNWTVRNAFVGLLYFTKVQLSTYFTTTPQIFSILSNIYVEFIILSVIYSISVLVSWHSLFLPE